MTLNKGLKALTTESEQAELAVIGRKASRKPCRLQYLKGSAKMGLRLWNVLQPKLEGYTYGPDSGFPTFGLQTLKDKGVI